MQCKQIDDLIMKYFDGNISELELEQLLRHTQKCESCAVEFEVFKDAIFEVENLPEIEPPENLTANIMAAVSTQRHYQLNTQQLICWLVGFVGLVVFTYNIFAFVLVPVVGGSPLVSFQSLVGLGYWMADAAKESLVALSIGLGKLLIIRNILFRDYMIYVCLWLAMFAAADLLLYKLVSLSKKNDFRVE